jgi:hypothetical protein
MNLSAIKIRRPFFILLLFKLFYTVYGVFVFGKISSISDADSYLISPIDLSMSVLTSNTVLMGTVTAILKKILFVDFFVHLAYSIGSFYFLKVVIEELKLTSRQEYFLILMLVLPSFGTWTSIIVKESLSCSLSCVVLVWIINILNDERRRFPLLVSVACLYLTVVLRPIVGFGLFCLIANLYLYRVPFLNKYIKFFFIVGTIVFVTTVGVIFTLDYVQDQFIPMAEYYFNPKFSAGANSGRPLGFFKTAADFYIKAPEGVFIANLGPNLAESLRNPFFIPYFFEGLFFMLVVGCLLFLNVFYESRRRVLNPNFLFTIFFGVILILLLNYPFGLYNAGSAIRYRSSYYHIVIVLLMYFYAREKKLIKANLLHI